VYKRQVPISEKRKIDMPVNQGLVGPEEIESDPQGLRERVGEDDSRLSLHDGSEEPVSRFSEGSPKQAPDKQPSPQPVPSPQPLPDPGPSDPILPDRVIDPEPPSIVDPVPPGDIDW
jgi:hypothetical protein